jgi:hypothetical protein
MSTGGHTSYPRQVSRDRDARSVADKHHQVRLFCCGAVALVMAEDPFALELRTAQERRAYWRAQYDAALAVNDSAGASFAMEHLRQYDWLISWIEGARNPH